MKKKLIHKSLKDNDINILNSFCKLYEKECMGKICSVTPYPHSCKYLKKNS